MKLFPAFAAMAAAFALASCYQQKPNTNFETGRMMSVKMGTIQKVTKMNVTRNVVGQGTFAEMASGAASAVTPGFLAPGTTKIASATGSLMDSKVETVAKVRIRVKLDDGDLIEVFQNDVPGITFKAGQKVAISTGDTPGNVWPE